MTTFPGSPRLLKGALVGTDPVNPLASVIVFQYNPDTMTRRLDARSMGGESGDRNEVFRLTGPPKENISFTAEIDAADQVDILNPASLVSGIYPTLSALEMLLYPKSDTVIANAALSLLGNIEIIPPEAPMTLFVWGPQRVLPVRLPVSASLRKPMTGCSTPSGPKWSSRCWCSVMLILKSTIPATNVPGAPDRQRGDGYHKCIQ